MMPRLKSRGSPSSIISTSSRATQGGDRAMLAESGHGTTLWLCEKWSGEAVEFARKKLDRAGIEKIVVPHGHGRKLVPVGADIPSAWLRELVGKAEEEIEV